MVFNDYADATLRRQAVASLAEHGPMALAMLDKYAADADFRDVLRRFGPAVIPPIARSDSGPEALAALKAKPAKGFTEVLAEGVLSVSGESGQATIRQIQKDGLDRVAELNSDEVGFAQFLPLYDLVHLGGVVTRGHSPTSGEMAWALVDGCFVVLDVLSLSALQPEAAAAVEATRSEVKAATREGAKIAGREALEDASALAAKATARQGAEAAGERLAKWWAVRAVGGTYRVLRKMPEALAELTLPRITAMARTFCAKAGLRLSEFGPRRFLVGGVEKLVSIPPTKGLKYLGVQAVQATVGVVAFHKMEEHLASRRPPSP